MKGGISVNAAVINKNAKLQRVPEACADTNWSRNTLDMQMGQRNAMRACLSPLIGIGEQYGVTSLIVVHTNKKQGVFGRNC